jgi:outer membrane lipoprotein LolB
MQSCVNQGLVQKQSQPSAINKLSNLSEVEYWCMTGRSAAKYEGSGWQAGVRWCREKHKITLELTGPMGINAAILSYRYGELWIQDGSDQLSISHQPEQMLRSRLGFFVPLTALNFWLLGKAEPGRVNHQQYNQGLLDVLTQHGWRIEYDKYSSVNGYRLPKKIRLTRDAVSLKIVVDEWRLGK